MKTLVLFFTALLSIQGFAQCIDESQIDTDAPCPDVWAPVCGCDGITYANSCEAINYGGVLGWTEGVCAQSYFCLDLSDVSFGDCDLFLGYGYVDGECVEINGCSTVGGNGFDYAGSIHATMQACEIACSNVENCIEPDYLGLGLCTEQYDPVCGCDGNTYTNLCQALFYHGITSWTDGPCPEGQPCVDLAGVDFGDCDQFLGYGYVDGECVGISGCGTFAGLGIDFAPFIYQTAEACEWACSNFDGCTDPDNISITPCPNNWDPVCGCDGQTYSNLCKAITNGGIGSWSLGECPYQCIDENLIQDPVLCPQNYDPVCGCNGVTYHNACYAQQSAGVTAWLEGECADTDGDGTPDVLDCDMFDPQKAAGLPCDDGDETTIDDKYNDCCECEGVSTVEPCPSDLNYDGVVNTTDLLLFLSTFGSICQ